MSENRNYHYEMELLAKNMIAVSEKAKEEYEEMLLSLQADILDNVFKQMELDKKVKQAYKEGYKKGKEDAKAGIINS